MQIFTKNYKNASLVFLCFVFLFSFSISAQVGIGTTDPKSTFEVNGTFGQKVSTVTATTALDDSHGSVIICNNGSTAITVTLPAVSACTGRVYTIKRNGTSTAIVTIAGTIDGVTNLILLNPNDAVSLFSNGSEWKAASNSNLTSSWSVNGNTGTTATNFVGTIDAKDLVLKTNNTSRVNITSAGVTTIGGATDRTKFEADGTIVLEGAATVWDDFLVNPDATSRGGSKTPVWGGTGGTAFKNNSGSQGVFLWMFSASQEQEVYFTVQLPHKYKVGTDLYPHVHWTTATGTPTRTNVVWGLEYTVMKIGSAFPNTILATGNSIIGGIPTISGSGQHLITSLGTISGTGIEISTILVCRLYRATSDSNDTFGNEVGLLSMDFHYEMDTEGSRSEYTK
jgi:hypothetical protein